MTVPISDEELDHQRDVLQAMMDHGIPMSDGGIAKALAVIERLDQAERRITELTASYNMAEARIFNLTEVLRTVRYHLTQGVPVYALATIDKVLGES